MDPIKSQQQIWSRIMFLKRSKRQPVSLMMSLKKHQPHRSPHQGKTVQNDQKRVMRLSLSR